jgi:hypothetical protein
MKKALVTVAALLPLVLASPAHADVILGQVQTFDDPDHHWVFGAGPMVGMPTPFPVALGGPGGPADPFLQILATGGTGPLSRLSAQNFEEWSGDYVAAGVNRLTMDVKNFGPDDLFLRLLFIEFGAMGPIGAALTTAPVFVAAGSDWDTVAFSIGPSALTGLFGTGIGALSNAGELRLFHNPDPMFVPGMNPTVTATLGVDNITAAVPEPGVITLLSGAFAALLTLRRKSSRRPSSLPL